MVYQRKFNAETEIRQLKAEMKALGSKGAEKPSPAPRVSSQTARIIRQRADRAMNVVDEQAATIADQEARIASLEKIVAQLIRRGRIPCQEQLCSQSSPSQSLRSASSY